MPRATGDCPAMIPRHRGRPGPVCAQAVRAGVLATLPPGNPTVPPTLPYSTEITYPYPGSSIGSIYDSRPTPPYTRQQKLTSRQVDKRRVGRRTPTPTVKCHPHLPK
eukprot:753299-Hanusia_phi.AAC.5